MSKEMERIFGMQKFVQFTKADEATHTVSGLVTAETPDKENETCNYKAAKKAYQQWSGEFQKATTSAGQKESLGNIRVQHSDEIGGKATSLDFDDDNKTVSIVTQPIDEDMWNKIAEGYYTGFSQGGDYAFRICQDCGDTVPKSKGNYCGNCKKVVGIEYGPVISEVSYVDNPCHGDAHFDLVKSDGTHQMVKFQTRSKQMETQPEADVSPAMLSKIATLVSEGVAAALAKASAKTKRVAGEDLTSDCFAYVGDKDDTSTWKLPIKFSTDEKTKSHIRNALARFNQTKGIPAGEKDKVKAKLEAAAKKHGIDVADDANKSSRLKELIKNFVEQKLAERLPDNLSKDMYGVARFAGLINDLAYLVWNTQYEAEIELDNSELPDALQEDLENLVETFLAMAEEESTELTAALAERIGKVMKVTPTGLDKAYSKAAGIINKIKKAVDEHHEAMTSAHEEHAEKVKGHLDELKDCMNCEGGSKKTTPAPVKKASPHQETGASVDEQEEGEIEPIDPEEEGTENIAQKRYSGTEVEKIVDTTVRKVLETLFKSGDEEEEEEEEKPKPKTKKAAPAAGIGNRAEVVLPNAGPVIKTMPVRKEEENRMVPTKQPNTINRETVVKALQTGDRDAQLELMKSATPHNEVPGTLVAAVGALSKNRR